MSNWSFNLSYSAFSLYRESELVFFFSHILKSDPDTDTIQSYGLAGNVVHELAEKFLRDKSYDYRQEFDAKWELKNLHLLPGMNGKPLDKKKYIGYTNKVVSYISENLHDKGEIEPEVKLQMISEEYDGLTIKGFVDAIQKVDGKVIMYDYKTNSSADEESHQLQRLFYSWLYWKIHGIIPHVCKWIYLSRTSGQVFESDSFTIEDVLVFDSEIKKFIRDIKEKGKDISKYEVGSIDSPFNCHYHKCREEQKNRESRNVIYGIIENNILTLENVPDKLQLAIRQKYSYKVDGAEWSPAYKRHVWDGKKYLTKVVEKNGKRLVIMPYAFVNNFEALLSEYNTYYKQNIILSFEDRRNPLITEKVFKTKFTPSEIELRPYQNEAIAVMLQKKIGIINGGTGMGKTVIAAEFIRQTNRRTLFLVNRLELVTQTKQVFEEQLGVDVGEMSEGNLDVGHQITVGSIQTIFAIMKRKDASTKQLELFLANITLTIYDECQNVTDSGTYGTIAKYLKNVVYFVALSGSPWRTGNGSLEMNALCGFNEYTKTTAQLEAEGYLCPTKCLFVKYDANNNSIDSFDADESYHEVYTKYVVDNEKRNKAIVDIVQKFRDTKKILVITKRVKHAEMLGQMIADSVVITGSTESDFRKTMFTKFKNTQGIVLIGSIQIFSTGVNIPDLDVILNCSAHKSSVSSVQICGRVKRKVPGKEFGIFLDFVDAHPYLKSSYKERKKILLEHGNEVVVVDGLQGLDDIQKTSGPLSQ